MSAWVDRSEALARLGVRPQTLYAYVSRGRIGSRPDPDDPRRSLYSAEDIDALARRRSRGRRLTAVAASAMAWGEPSISTSISTVIDGRLIYRGEDAAGLAESWTLERTAALLWGAEDEVRLTSALPPGEGVGGRRAAAFSTLAGLAAAGRPTLGRPVGILRVDAAEAVAALARALGAAEGEAPVHVRLARGWRVDDRAADAMRRALVLAADHELNASSFAARVAASTGASIAACLLAGLAALSGPRHGGAAEAVAALVEDAARLGSEAAAERWLNRDLPLPGFGHPLYPHGDPRAEALLATVELDETLASLRDAGGAATGARPNVDFALLALARLHGLPADAPFSLFALGRSVGWAAHALEQAGTGQLIRPRARYEGVRPGSAERTR
ncbi:MAG TPA: citrate synthase [Longimicrobiales bacterium]|nr:citrate synthase [Longimicrobiales bacterium]